MLYACRLINPHNHLQGRCYYFPFTGENIEALRVIWLAQLRHGPDGTHSLVWLPPEPCPLPRPPRQASWRSTRSFFHLDLARLYDLPAAPSLSSLQRPLSCQVLGRGWGSGSGKGQSLMRGEGTVPVGSGHGRQGGEGSAQGRSLPTWWRFSLGGRGRGGPTSERRPWN